MSIRRIAAAFCLTCLLLVLVSAAPAQDGGGQAAASVTATTFVISGRGWGHGVGMSQWGAYGYAKHGVGYAAILAHYYPGTRLKAARPVRVKVLLIEQAKRVVVSSPDAFTVQGASGAARVLPPGNYAVAPNYSLTSDKSAPPVRMTGPLTFRPGKSPLWLVHPFRGTFTVASDGHQLSVVNSVPVESYVRGVVSSEMPYDWPLEAVKAQAVAARSYALAHRRGGAFDVFADTRDQVYGGIAAETQVGDEAVAATKLQVLTYRGRVATTYFFASSGGRTAAITDVFASSKPSPYLVSVPDPYDSASPYHRWGPVSVPAAVASRDLHVPGVADLRPVPATSRARSVVVVGRAGDVTVPAADVRTALGLRSTWIRVGVLSLSRPVGSVAAGASTTLTGRAVHVSGVVLEQRPAGGDWQQGPALSVQPDGTFQVAVAPSVTTQYRLSTGPVVSAILRVVVTAT